MEFKVGDRVRLCKDSRYGDHSDTQGKVVDIDAFSASYRYRVRWRGNYWTWCYRGEDLELAEEVLYEI